MIHPEDRDIFDKVHRICLQKGCANYLDMATILGTSESFIKKVASGRAKFNLNHLRKFAEELECDVKDFL